MILERDGIAGLGERGFRFSSRNGRRLTCLCFHSVCFSWGRPYRSRCTTESALWGGQGLARSVGVPWVEVDISAASLSAGGLLCIDPLTHVQ